MFIIFKKNKIMFEKQVPEKYEYLIWIYDNLTHNWPITMAMTDNFVILCLSSWYNFGIAIVCLC